MYDWRRRKTWRCALCAGVVCGLLAVSAFGQTVTVDNSDPEFTIIEGSWTSGSYGSPYGADYDWVETTAIGGDPTEAEWRPNLPQAGDYQVSTWYVQGGNRANNAPFYVHHTGGSTLVTVNQQLNGETWYDLGTYSFAAGTSAYVTLDNDANASVVIADAVRFQLASGTVELTMAVAPPAGGTTNPTEGGSYLRTQDEVTPIEASAGLGYEFDHWNVSAGVAPAGSYDPATTVMMDQSKTVTAVFAEDGTDGEFRGFWADAFHEGFKSESEIDSMISRALTGNYNAIIPEVLAFQDTSTSDNGHGAYWQSSIIPWASVVVEDEFDSFDPLEYLVTQAHAAGLEVHPWLVAFRVSASWPPNGNAIMSAHPEWLMVPQSGIDDWPPATVGGYYTLDPGSPDVQDYLVSIVRELVSDYEIDGIHWDYIRYVQTDAGYPSDSSYERSTLRRFQNITGYVGTPPDGLASWDDFRRRTITEFVRRVMSEVPTIENVRQPLRHTAALVTWYPPPPGGDFHQTRPYYDTFSDWEYWQSMGYLDATIPMSYFDENSYPITYRSWVDYSVLWATTYNRHTFIGPGIYMNTFDDSVTQLLYARTAGADGYNTYSYRSTNDGGQPWANWYSYVASNVSPSPVAPPTMPWRDPAEATKGAVYGRVTDGATGQPVDDAELLINGSPSGIRTDGGGYYILTKQLAGASGTTYSIGARYSGYSDVVRPAVLIERAGYTEANLAFGAWLPGDYDVDGDVDLDDYARFAECMTGPDGGPITAGCDLFDSDTDDDIDFEDFNVFQSAFTG